MLKEVEKLGFDHFVNFEINDLLKNDGTKVQTTC